MINGIGGCLSLGKSHLIWREMERENGEWKPEAAAIALDDRSSKRELDTKRGRLQGERGF